MSSHCCDWALQHKHKRRVCHCAMTHTSMSIVHIAFAGPACQTASADCNRTRDPCPAHAQAARAQGGDAGAGAHVARGTALEVLEAVSPVMAATSAIASIFFEPLVHTLRTSAYFNSLPHIAATAGLVGTSALLAFAMVWTEFALIASTSALTFMVAGVFKEIVTVLVAHVVFGDEFTPLNGFGLAVLISGVCLFNYQRYLKLRAEARGGGSGGGSSSAAANGSTAVAARGEAAPLRRGGSGSSWDADDWGVPTVHPGADGQLQHRGQEHQGALDEISAQ